MTEAQAWTPERLTELQQHLRNGFSFTQIAEKMQVSRNSIASAKFRWLGDNFELREHRKRDGNGPVVKPNWTDEEVYQLRELAGQGKTYKQIAAILNRSHSAVAKQCAKYKIKPVKAYASKQTQAWGKWANQGARKPKPSRARPMAKGEKWTDCITEGFMGQTGKLRIDQLEHRHCRFPIEQKDGSTLYCGDTTTHAGGSYCQHHYERVYRTAQSQEQAAA